MKRDKPADVVFVLDATNSMQMVFTALVDYIEKIANELNDKYKRALFYFGAVIYRDPVSYKPEPPSIPVDPETQAQLDAVHIQNLKDKHKYDEQEEARKKERKLLFDHIKYPENINVVIDLAPNFKKLKSELQKIDCKSGNDDPEDWAGALDLALNYVSWRNGSKKMIVWISDENAHGRRFCGDGSHFQEEEGKLVALVQQMARENIYFRGINIMKNDTGCKRTLNEIQKIYMENHGKNFNVEELKVEKDEDLDEYDVSPDFYRSFEETIMITIRNAYPHEIFE